MEREEREEIGGIIISLHRRGNMSNLMLRGCKNRRKSRRNVSQTQTTLGGVVVAKADSVLGLVEDRLVRLVRARELVTDLLGVRLGRVGLKGGGGLVEVLLGLLANALLRVGLEGGRGL